MYFLLILLIKAQLMIGGGEIAGAAIGGISSLFKLGMGIDQMIKGKSIQRQLDAQGRPIEKTPQAFTEAEGLVRSQYLDPRMMGEADMREAIKARGANQLQNIQQTAGSGLDALMAYNLSNNNTDKQLTDLGIQSAQQQQKDYQQLLNTLAQKAIYQQSQFQNNVLQPYKEKAAQAQALVGAGTQNISNGINDAGSTAVAIGQLVSKDKTNDQNQALYQQILSQFGNKAAPVTTPPPNVNMPTPINTGVSQYNISKKIIDALTSQNIAELLPPR